MAFTAPQITHSFDNADGTAGSGAIKFTLLGRITNSGTTLVPSSITANLSGTGGLAQAVTSTLDPGTWPTGVMWRIDIAILGASEESFVVPVPPVQTDTAAVVTNGSAIVQLSTLTAETWMFGQSITGTDIPASTSIIAVNTTANQVTMSANATGTHTGSYVLGATIDLGQLLPQQQQVN